MYAGEDTPYYYIGDSVHETYVRIGNETVIADIFAILGYMERKGSGIGKVIDGYRNAENFKEDKLPTFYSDKSQFTVIFPNLNYGYKEEEDGGQKGGQKRYSNRQDEILSLIKHNPKMIRKEMSDSIGINESAIQKHIEQLKQRGIIKRIGGSRGGYWKINED